MRITVETLIVLTVPIALVVVAGARGVEWIVRRVKSGR